MGYANSDKIDNLIDNLKKVKIADSIFLISLSVGLLAGVISIFFTFKIQEANTQLSNFNINDLSSKINQTQNELNSLKSYDQNLVNNLKTSTGSAELKSVEARVTQLEEKATQLEKKDDALSQTILEDP